jgi:AraC-like DNA-binding protein
MPAQSISKKVKSRQSPHVVFGDVIYAAGGRHGPRRQTGYQIVTVESGEAQVTIDDRVVLVPARHALLLRPGHRETFRFSAMRPTRHAWCSVQSALLPSHLREACETAPELQPLQRRLETLLQLGLSVPRHVGAESDPLVEALALAALEEFVFTARAGRGAAPEPDALWRAMEWVANLGDEPASLAAMAQAADVSASQLAKLFRTHLRTTPMRYVWKTRTERGVQLLQETGLSVAETAYRCGFQTPFHFSRWVRHHFGASPSELRRRAAGV